MTREEMKKFAIETLGRRLCEIHAGRHGYDIRYFDSFGYGVKEIMFMKNDIGFMAKHIINLNNERAQIHEQVSYITRFNSLNGNRIDYEQLKGWDPSVFEIMFSGVPFKFNNYFYLYLDPNDPYATLKEAWVIWGKPGDV